MAQHNEGPLAGQTALVTGGARRIGARLVRHLHAAGAAVAIHCNRSRGDAEALAAELEQRRAGSTAVLAAELLDPAACAGLPEQARAAVGRLDIVVNNASTFYPTPIGGIDVESFDDLVGTNLRAPTFIAQASVPALSATGGCIVNVADIHGQRPLAEHPVYCAAKAGLIMLTHSLARELAPEVRVNAIAPGSILWPEGPGGDDPDHQQGVIEATPLARQGDPDDIAGALLYLVGAPFVTGQVLAVDGGRAL